MVKFYRSTVLQRLLFTLDDGGWTVLHRRGGFGADDALFNKTWKDYKLGFGNLKQVLILLVSHQKMINFLIILITSEILKCLHNFINRLK